MAMGPISARSGSRRRAPMSEINVTPMVDVMLVLLIIFMVTAPLLTAGVPVDLPDSRANALPQEQEVTDAILPDVLQQIAAKAEAGKPPQVFLRADRKLDYGRVMRVMGELNLAGLNRVSLVTVGDERP